MHTIVLVLHVIFALALVGLILIQHGKGADARRVFVDRSRQGLGVERPQRVAVGAVTAFNAHDRLTQQRFAQIAALQVTFSEPG